MKQKTWFGELVDFAGLTFVVAPFLALTLSVLIIFGFGTFFHMPVWLSFALTTSWLILGIRALQTNDWSYIKKAAIFLAISIFAAIALSFLLPILSGIGPIISGAGNGGLNGVHLPYHGPASGPGAALSKMDLGSVMAMYQYFAVGMSALFAVFSLFPSQPSAAAGSSSAKPTAS